MLYSEDVPDLDPTGPHAATRALGLGVYDAAVYDFGEVRAYIGCQSCEAGHSIFEADGLLWARTIHADDCERSRVEP